MAETRHMIRVRSPLFPLTYLFACVFGIGAGDLVHLWAIGKHVSHIVVIEASKAPAGTWGLSEDSGDGCAKFFMWVLPVVSTVIAGAVAGSQAKR